MWDIPDKVHYNTIDTIEGAYEWSCSKNDLEDILQAELSGQILRKVYVNLNGYLEGCSRDANYYDFSYMGGEVLMLFDRCALELLIHVQGMIQYRIVDLQHIRLHPHYGTPPEDMVLSEIYFHDLSQAFALSYENQVVCDIKVDGTNYCGFIPDRFDEEKAILAMYQNLLPNNVHFKLGNNVTVSLMADAIENFIILLDET